MKIGLVRRGYSDTGGAERYLMRFADGLEQEGHDCVLFSDQPWPESAWGSREQIGLKTGKNPGDFATALKKSHPKEHCDFLFSLERVWECDCYRAGDGVHAAWLKRRSRVESFGRSAFRSLQSKHRQILKLEQALFGPDSKAHLIANAQFVAEEIAATYGTPADRITVIPNGFDAPSLDPFERMRFRERGRAERSFSADTVVFLFVGSGWERKGLRFAVAAVESLVDQGHDVHLLVAGKDKRPPRLRHPGTTSFLGPLSAEELGQAYEAADVFLLPTLYDPFSNACLEAASHGLPIITTEANGIADLFPELRGTLVPGPDGPALAEACGQWLESDPRLEARALNREIAGRYSVARNVEATLTCFEKLI